MGRITISTHAPLRGATLTDIDFENDFLAFLLTRLCEARHEGEITLYGDVVFLLTRLCEARRAMVLFTIFSIEISTHAPLRGATRSPRCQRTRH